MDTPATKSGLYVRAAPGLKLRDRKVTRLAAKVRAAMPWLELADWPTVRAWCELEYLTGQVYAALRGLGPVTSQGEARRLLDDYRKLRQTQIVLSRELGMTPASRMAIKANGSRAAFDLAEQVTTRAVEISEARGTPPHPPAPIDDEDPDENGTR